MANNNNIFERPRSSTDFDQLTDSSLFETPPPKKSYHHNDLLSSFGAVCFCCFATDVPLINAKKCSHKEFVNVYLSMVPSIPLLICNICHHMLKKIKHFKSQIQNNFKKIVSKKKTEERCIFVNDLSINPTISIVFLKPMTKPIKVMSITYEDPLFVSEVDHHESFVDDHLGSNSITYNEESIIKTEPDEVPNTIIPQSCKDTGQTRFYMELTPTNIKQEIPTTHNKHPPNPQKKLGQSIDSTLLENSKKVKPLPMPFKKPLDPKSDTIKQNIEKGTNNYLVNLLNSVNKPLNLQYKTEPTMEKSLNKTECGTESDIVRNTNVYLDECYKSKINTFTMTEAELLKQREKERLEESFLKKKYKCESCIEGFQFEVQFNKHNKRYHTNKDYPIECIVCKKRYTSYHTLDRHMEKHLVRYFCLVCGKQSDNLHALTEHYNETHKDKEPIQMKFECRECDYVTYYKIRLNNHRNRMHKVYTCKICNQKLNGYGSHKYHMKYVHDHDDDKEVKGKGIYKCDECPASYTYFGSLKAHKKTRHVGEGPPTPVYCKPCNKFLSNKYAYNEHVKHSAAHKHENNYLKFECDHCHEKYPVKRSLKLHIERLHLKIFNYQCNICNKLCVHNQALAHHIRTVHEKKKPPKTDVCHVCGKVYCSKEVLKKHMRIHTGERPHACDLCGMTFTQSSTLATHKKLKHKIPKKNEVLKEDSVVPSSWGN